MIFKFLPFKLKSSFKLLENNLSFDSRDNEVDYYKVVELPVNEILEIPVTSIALYFHNKRLIAAYYRLNADYSLWEQIVLKFEAYLMTTSMCWEENEGNLYNWKSGNQFLGILASKAENSIIIYHTHKKYNVFDDYPL